ncbi:hypothetical protein OH491_23720 [Termitidicoccus mucosus]|uniref:Uncharacterized protein n=1 Tax=Termitidicoccus mucosus TaxID=1184151 RepID=A0A178INN0_9BACT|nr:hypothetical protein AW736_02765 [Opitutaceae bacterium TSB47]
MKKRDERLPGCNPIRKLAASGTASTLWLTVALTITITGTGGGGTGGGGNDGGGGVPTLPALILLAWPFDKGRPFVEPLLKGCA